MTWPDIVHTKAPGWSILVRFLVGLIVFLPEGIQKLMFPDVLGVGRFAKIGIPFPDLMGPFVGVIEITCGVLIIAGLLTRFAAIPLIVIMIVALVSTKLPILLAHDLSFSLLSHDVVFHLPQDLKRFGFWSTAHEARADLTMLLGCVYLLIVGAGRWSVDALLHRNAPMRR